MEPGINVPTPALTAQKLPGGIKTTPGFHHRGSPRWKPKTFVSGTLMPASRLPGRCRKLANICQMLSVPGTSWKTTSASQETQGSCLLQALNPNLLPCHGGPCRPGTFLFCVGCLFMLISSTSHRQEARGGLGTGICLRDREKPLQGSPHPPLPYL